MTDSGSSEPTGSPLSSRSTSLFGWSSRLKEIHVGPRTVPCAVVKFDRPAAFAESLIRLRVNLARALPDYLRLYLTSRQGSAAPSRGCDRGRHQPPTALRLAGGGNPSARPRDAEDDR